MVIELRGLGFVNKGASLMLYAILEKIKSEFPDAIIAMECNAVVPKRKINELGIYQKFILKKKGVNLSFLASLMPNNLRRKSMIVTESEVDVILDGSGFAFGDKWGAKFVGNILGNHIESWKKNGKKIILLPQAFGPFSNEELRKQMKTIVNNSDLIFARDQMSLDYIAQIAPKRANIKLKPDFTNLISGVLPKGFIVSSDQVAIIPNSQMLKHTNSDTKNKYPQFIKEIIEHIQSLGLNPFFLIHAGQGDVNIANVINSNLELKIPIVIEESPLAVKGIIGSCRAVVTSRFHGLVSALSQAVPCCATSWNHKYEMLLNDYDYPEGLLDVSFTSGEVKDKLNLICQTDSNTVIRQRLLKSVDSQKQLSIKMWDEVFATIRN